MTEESRLTRREQRLLYLAAAGAVVVLLQFVVIGWLAWNLLWGGPWAGERSDATIWSCEELVRDDPGWVLCGDETGTFRRGNPPAPATPRVTRAP